MKGNGNPSEIARETLRQLALKRIPPTPDNYRRLYSEISGAKDHEAFPYRPLHQLLAAIESQSGKTVASGALGSAIEAQDWALTSKALLELASGAGTDAKEWREIVPSFLREWERPLAGITTAQKRAALERALDRCTNDLRLRTELGELATRWASTPTRQGGDASEDAADRPASPVSGKSAIGEACAQLLRIAVEMTADASTPLADEASRIADRIQNTHTTKDLSALAPELKRITFRLELAAEDANEVRAGVLHLLQLLIDNVGELVVDDRWLHGQIEIVRELISQPRNLRAIDDAERRIRDVIIQQSSLKASLLEARDAMKEMLSGFVQRLASFADDTSHYHDKIEACSRRISAASDIRDLSEVLREVIQETRTIQLAAQRSRDELRDARLRVEEAERRIHQLQDELGRASELVRHDQLTGTLNRRGLEDAFDREISRAARHQRPISLAVLDIDDFKKLNDALGHQAGDAALVHLAEVIRGTLRPQDTVARYGGEEFIIILPDTPIQEAKEALVRLQRELTKRFFLHDNQRLLITFSAGVTQLSADTTRDQAIKRADELMYEAKRAGKNRVVGD